MVDRNIVESPHLFRMYLFVLLILIVEHICTHLDREIYALSTTGKHSLELGQWLLFLFIFKNIKEPDNVPLLEFHYDAGGSIAIQRKPLIL